MNYTTLIAQIIAYANRGGSIEFANAVPYFIEMGQQKIWKELNTTGFQKVESKNFLILLLLTNLLIGKTLFP